jgi:hypothetical protein
MPSLAERRGLWSMAIQSFEKGKRILIGDRYGRDGRDCVIDRLARDAGF